MLLLHEALVNISQDGAALRARAAELHAKARSEVANPERREYFRGQAELLEEMAEQLEPPPDAEREIAEITRRFRQHGYDVWTHQWGDVWSAPYFRLSPWTGTGAFAVGSTALEAAEAAWAQFEATVLAADRSDD